MSTSVFRQLLVPVNRAALSRAGGVHSECDCCRASDEHLIAQIQSGGHEALEHLFNRYSESVFRMAHRILRDHGEAEDLTQDVFLHVFRGVQQYNPQRGAVRTWLMAIACHRSLDRRRYLDCRKYYAQVGVERAERTGRRTYETPGLREAGLQDALQRLSAAERRTIELYCFEGFSLQEIALKLGESFCNTRHHYYRGIEHLRKHLKDCS